MGYPSEFMGCMYVEGKAHPILVGVADYLGTHVHIITVHGSPKSHVVDRKKNAFIVSSTGYLCVHHDIDSPFFSGFVLFFSESNAIGIFIPGLDLHKENNVGASQFLPPILVTIGQVVLLFAALFRPIRKKGVPKRT